LRKKLERVSYNACRPVQISVQCSPDPVLPLEVLLGLGGFLQTKLLQSIRYQFLDPLVYYSGDLCLGSTKG
jgi:hypothetical protein